MSPHTAYRRIPLLTLAALTVAGVATAGCAGQGSAEGAGANAPVVVEVSDRFVTVENRTGLPLVNVSVSIETLGDAVFGTTVPRIENLQRHQVAVQQLRNAGGTAFNPAFSQARTVRVVATDLTGRRYEAEADAR